MLEIISFYSYFLFAVAVQVALTGVFFVVSQLSMRHTKFLYGLISKKMDRVWDRYVYR